MNTKEAQIEHLRKRITEDETGTDKFTVIPIEASIGKSRSTDRIVGEYIANGGTRTFLIIKPFIKDVKHTVAAINQCNDYETVAIGITSDDWKKYRHALYTLLDVPVIVTTRERYKQLCTNRKIAKEFANRHTLIIDEALDVDVYSFSENDLKWAESKLPSTLHEMLLKVCDGLLIAIQRLRPKEHAHHIVPCYPKLGDGVDLRNFRAMVYANLDVVEEESREQVRKFVTRVEMLYGNPCYYQNGTLYARDESFHRFTLQNNIILDANGRMDATYKYDPCVSVDNMPLLTDHSQWTLTQVKFTSSASNIGQSDNYWEKVCELIKQKQTNNSRTFVVCHNKHQGNLDEMVKRQGINVEIEHFGNIVGKNDWRDYDQVWIVGTPNVPAPVYPLRYAAAKGTTIPRTTIQMVRGSGKLTFADSWLESIKHSYVLCEVYQAIKRINRDNSKPAQVFVVTSDDKLISDLAAQMKNIRRTLTIQLDGVTVKGKEKRAPKVPQLLRDWLVTASKGTYSKSSICKMFGITNLNRYLKHDDILQLEQSGRIIIGRHSITVLH